MTALTPVRRMALAGLLTLFALPTAATAADAPTGGLDASTSTTAPAAAPAAAVQPTPTRGSADLAGAGTWSAVPSGTPGRPVRIAGSFATTLAGRGVTVQRRTPTGRWLRAASTTIRSTGRFATTWKTQTTTVSELRVVVADRAAKATSDAAASARAAADAPTVRIAVLGRARASWYGPGFYGHRTACGITLTAQTVGVAHRTLPCGTQVEVRRGGHTVVVPVIDRGPFANGASFDLTKGAADDLGLDGVGQVSYVQRDDLAPLATPSRAPAMTR